MQCFFNIIGAFKLRNCPTARRFLKPQSSWCNAGMLLIVFTTFIYFISPFEPNIRDVTCHPNVAMNGELVEANQALENKTKDCQLEKKNMTSSLEAERENQRTYQILTDQLKVCKEETKRTEQINQQLREDKTILQAHQEFFNFAMAALRNTPYPGVENHTRYTVARLGMKPLAGIEPLNPEFGSVINDVTSFRYPITIPACQTNVSANQSVFIAVISAPGNFDKRNTIRQTWREHLKLEYHKSLMTIAGFAFILGMSDHNDTQIKIEEESKNNGDIIQIDMDDFYRNLSLKVAGLFNWLYRNCPKVDFILKVDDDVYVNVRNLVHFVISFHQSKHTLFGLPASTSLTPLRSGKWEISFEEWPWNEYPNYYLGPGVLFSGGSIIPLLAAFQTTAIMPFDDLYVMGLCAEKAGLNRTVLSSNYTTVYAMDMSAIPLACDLRRFLSWLTISGTHMNSSHVATDDFYNNRTQCLIIGSNGTYMTIDHNEPVQFYLV